MQAGAGKHHALYRGLWGAALSLGRGQRKSSEQERWRERDEGCRIIAESVCGQARLSYSFLLLQLNSPLKLAPTEGRGANRCSPQSGRANGNDTLLLKTICFILVYRSPVIYYYCLSFFHYSLSLYVPPLSLQNKVQHVHLPTSQPAAHSSTSLVKRCLVVALLELH